MRQLATLHDGNPSFKILHNLFSKLSARNTVNKTYKVAPLTGTIMSLYIELNYSLKDGVTARLHASWERPRYDLLVLESSYTKAEQWGK
jgi:hypothetical protein